MNKPFPLWTIILIPLYVVGIFSVILFPVAQDWTWLEGWTLIIIIAINLGVGNYFINKYNPSVLRNRMKMKKEGITKKTKKPAQSDWFIFPMLFLGFIGALIVPAIDYRYNWSTIPLVWKLVGFFFLNLGTMMMELAMLQNAYASKVLDVRSGQELIKTGLYGHVRHPLYTGSIIMVLGMPIALGSLYGLLPAIVGAYSLIFRIRFEEQMLLKGMQDYKDYQKEVKYKLLPHIY